MLSLCLWTPSFTVPFYLGHCFFPQVIIPSLPSTTRPHGIFVRITFTSTQSLIRTPNSSLSQYHCAVNNLDNCSQQPCNLIRVSTQKVSSSETKFHNNPLYSPKPNIYSLSLTLLGLFTIYHLKLFYIFIFNVYYLFRLRKKGLHESRDFVYLVQLCIFVSASTLRRHSTNIFWPNEWTALLAVGPLETHNILWPSVSFSCEIWVVKHSIPQLPPTSKILQLQWSRSPLYMKKELIFPLNS